MPTRAIQSCTRPVWCALAMARAPLSPFKVNPPTFHRRTNTERKTSGHVIILTCRRFTVTMLLHCGRKLGDPESESHIFCLTVLLIQATRGQQGSVCARGEGLPQVISVHLITVTVCELRKQTVFDWDSLTGYLLLKFYVYVMLIGSNCRHLRK